MLQPHSRKSPARAHWRNIALPPHFEIWCDMRDCGQDLIFTTPWITLCVFANEKVFELWDVMLSKCPKIACILVDFVIVPVLCTCPKACKRSVWGTADSRKLPLSVDGWGQALAAKTFKVMLLFHLPWSLQPPPPWTPLLPNITSVLCLQ